MVKYLIFVLPVVSTVVILTSCDNSTDHELTLEKNPYNGDELRIDGYYFHEEIIDKDTVRNIYFLCSDGTFIYGNSFENKNAEYIENYYSSGKFYNNFHDQKGNWGVFTVNGTELIITKWLDRAWTNVAINYNCQILNDSTFKLIKLVNNDTKNETQLNHIYHFKQFDHKPDSTNNYIK